MSILRTYNLQNPDSATNNIELTTNGGAVATGIVTATGGLNVGAGGTVITTTAGGRVGIGTDNPGQKLQVDGNIYLKNTGSYIQKDFQDNTEEYILRGPTLSSYNPTITWTRSAGTANRGLKIGAHDNVGAATTWVSIWNGVVTIPNQICFHAYKYDDGGQVASGTYVYNATLINRGSGYNTSNGRFTAPTTGAYYFMANIQYFGSPTGQIAIWFNVNGSQAWLGTASGQFYDDSAGGSVHENNYSFAILQLNAGDYVTLERSNTTRGMQSHFVGYLIG